MGTAEFEASRARLTALAQRMLGSAAEAEDAVQEAWLRLDRNDPDEIGNLQGWLTTVVARICLDQLRSRRSRPVAAEPAELEVPAAARGPEEEALRADAVGAALLMVLDTLAPAERTAFVLHDLFGVPFEEVAPVVGRSVPAARQLASRARRRVRGGAVDPDRARRQHVVTAFLAASRDGDFDALLTLLDPDAELRLDDTALAMGGAQPIAGREPMARFFDGRAKAARLALLDGDPGAVWMQGHQVRVAFVFDVTDQVRTITLVADRVRLEAMEIELA